MARLKSLTKEICGCRRTLADVLQSRVNQLQGSVDDAMKTENYRMADILRAKRQEAQLALNTILLHE